MELKLWEGNRERRLSEVFVVEGKGGSAPGDVTIHVSGNLSRIQRMGAGMTDGEVRVQGDVGMHIGSEMSGGNIIVDGYAGSWVGSAMTGGTIEVKKDAGDFIGAPYRGSNKGMRGGTIVIHGNAGSDVGSFMRKGLIEVCGNVGMFLGIHMKDGVIVVRGNAKERVGAFMTGGKIIVCGNAASVLPSFTISSIKKRAKAEKEAIEGPFYLFVGDLAQHGTGRLYVSKNKNEYLKSYEKLL